MANDLSKRILFALVVGTAAYDIWPLAKRFFDPREFLLRHQQSYELPYSRAPDSTVSGSGASAPEPRSLYNHHCTSPPDAPPDAEAKSRALGPTYENIEEVEWMYSSPQAREIFHQGLTRIMADIAWSDEPAVRCETMNHLQDVFFSSAFGLRDPAKIRRGTLDWSKIMDEDRAQRIYEHSLTYHGQGHYITGDICLNKFVDESRRHQEREDARCKTWEDMAVKYLGARPVCERRILRPDQRAIGEYRFRR